MITNKQKWLAIGTLWFVVAVFFATQGPLQDVLTGGTIDLWTSAISEIIYCFFWFAFTPLVLHVALVLPLSGPQRRRNLLYHVLLAFLVGAFQLATYCFAAWVLGVFPWEQESYWAFLTSFTYLFHLNVLFYIVIISIDYAVRYYITSSEREVAAAQLEALLTKSQLQNLTMQLHPHFLFNTMNTISVLMREDVNKANGVLIRFSQLLRQTLSMKDSPESTIDEEIGFIKEYLDIEQIRFGDRLQVHYEIDPPAGAALLPRLLLQPLVENALKHGINQQYGEGTITIRVRKDDRMLEIAVEDTGSGAGSKETAQTGTGLANTRARLQTMYGTNHSFEFTLVKGRGCHVIIRIPFQT